MVVETAHDARVDARMMNFALDGLLDLSRFRSATSSLGGDLADFLADDTLDDAFLHLPAAVTATSRSGAGASSGSGRRVVAGSGSTRVGSVRASRIGGAAAVVTGAVLRVVDNLGTGESVAGTWVVNVGNEDSWVGIGVATGESNDIASGWDFGVGFIGRIAQVELNAGGVELGATWRATIVQSEDLVTEEILTTGQVGRKGDVEELAGIVVVQRQSPETVIHSSLFVNLEPLGR